MGITYGFYEILEELPSWTSGVAYRAKHRKTGDIAALKIMDLTSVSDEEKTSFYEMAGNARVLSHKNIAKVIDVCRRTDVSLYDETVPEQESAYIVQEFITGTSLDRVIRKQGSFMPQLGFYIIGQVIAALEYGHKNKQPHRNLTMGNIMLMRNGKIKLVDYGVGRLFSSGTIFYMSPEDISGQEVTEQSEIFSIGIILFEVLVGVRPYKADNFAQLMNAIISGDFDPELIAKLPPFIEPIISKCIQPRTEERYTSFSELKKDIDGLQQSGQLFGFNAPIGGIPATEHHPVSPLPVTEEHPVQPVPEESGQAQAPVMEETEITEEPAESIEEELPEPPTVVSTKDDAAAETNEESEEDTATADVDESPVEAETAVSQIDETEVAVQEQTTEDELPAEPAAEEAEETEIPDEPEAEPEADSEPEKQEETEKPEESEPEEESYSEKTEETEKAEEPEAVSETDNEEVSEAEEAVTEQEDDTQEPESNEAEQAADQPAESLSDLQNEVTAMFGAGEEQDLTDTVLDMQAPPIEQPGVAEQEPEAESPPEPDQPASEMSDLLNDLSDGGDFSDLINEDLEEMEQDHFPHTARVEAPVIPQAVEPASPRFDDPFLQMISEVPMFGDLDEGSIRKFSAVIRTKSYTSGSEIIRKGQPGEYLYVILDGTVSVVQEDSDGNDMELTQLGEGDCFGEMSLLTGDPCSATIRSKGPSTMLTLSNDDFQTMLNEYPRISAHFNKILIKRLRNTNMKFENEIEKGMAGKLEMISLTELIQTLVLGRKTGKLDLMHTRQEGLIFFENGSIVSAYVDDFSGERAFYELLEWDEGTFRFAQDIDVPPEHNIDIDTNGLLMEGMRRIDETRKLLKYMQSPERVFIIQDDILKNLEILDLSEGACEVAQLFNGKRSINDIILVNDDYKLETLESVIEIYTKDLLEEVKPAASA